jgi:hypothetical protein
MLERGEINIQKQPIRNGFFHGCMIKKEFFFFSLRAARATEIPENAACIASLPPRKKVKAETSSLSYPEIGDDYVCNQARLLSTTA